MGFGDRVQSLALLAGLFDGLLELVPESAGLFVGQGDASATVIRFPRWLGRSSRARASRSATPRSTWTMSQVGESRVQ